MKTYDKIVEGTFDLNTFIENSILTYLDICIEEDLETEYEFLTDNIILETMDIMDNELIEEDI